MADVEPGLDYERPSAGRQLGDAIADARNARLEIMSDEAANRCLIEIADHEGNIVATVPPGDN